MKYYIIALLAAFIAKGSAQVFFNVNYDTSGVPSVSADDGSFPAPSGVPTVTMLSVNTPNTTHEGGASDQTQGLDGYWIDSYSSGDYFSFSLLAQPGQQIRMTGIWYSLFTDTQTGPSSISVDLLSLGGNVSEQVASGTFALNTFDILSDTHAVEIRFTGFGGLGDTGVGPHESFGVHSISAGFEVIPEPSALTLALFGGLLGAFHRKRIKI